MHVTLVFQDYNLNFQKKKIQNNNREINLNILDKNALLPSGFGDDHLCAILVELLPQLLVLEGHLGIVLYVVLLWGRRPQGREPGSEGQPGEVPGVPVGRAEGVGGPEAGEPGHGGGRGHGGGQKAAQAQLRPRQEGRGEGHARARWNTGGHHRKTFREVKPHQQ